MFADRGGNPPWRPLSRLFTFRSLRTSRLLILRSGKPLADGRGVEEGEAEFGREYPMWLNGKKVTTTEKRTSTNPSRPAEVIGVFQNATVEMARQAVEDANKFFDTWKRVPSQERAKFLFGAAQIVRERKYELMRWCATKWEDVGGSGCGHRRRRSIFLSFTGGKLRLVWASRRS